MFFLVCRLRKKGLLIAIDLLSKIIQLRLVYLFWLPRLPMQPLQSGCIERLQSYRVQVFCRFSFGKCALFFLLFGDVVQHCRSLRHAVSFGLAEQTFGSVHVALDVSQHAARVNGFLAFARLSQMALGAV